MKPWRPWTFSSTWFSNCLLSPQLPLATSAEDGIVKTTQWAITWLSSWTPTCFGRSLPLEIVCNETNFACVVCREAVTDVRYEACVTWPLYLDDAIEVDVDCISGGASGEWRRYRAAHRTASDTRSGDSWFNPPYSRQPERFCVWCRTNRGDGRRAGVWWKRWTSIRESKDGVVYILEVNPRCHVPVPFDIKMHRRFRYASRRCAVAGTKSSSGTNFTTEVILYFCRSKKRSSFCQIPGHFKALKWNQQVKSWA